MKKYFVHSFCV